MFVFQNGDIRAESRFHGSGVDEFSRALQPRRLGDPECQPVLAFRCFASAGPGVAPSSQTGGGRSSAGIPSSTVLRTQAFLLARCISHAGYELKCGLQNTLLLI